CERYLLEVLPLETAIEERCLFPRLLGKRPDIDEALELARSHRRAQAPLIQALLAELEGVRCHPTSARHRQRLLVLAERLAFELGKHLAYEERVLYPALGSLLTPEEQRAVLREMGPPRALDCRPSGRTSLRAGRDSWSTGAGSGLRLTPIRRAAASASALSWGEFFGRSGIFRNVSPSLDGARRGVSTWLSARARGTTVALLAGRVFAKARTAAGTCPARGAAGCSEGVRELVKSCSSWNVAHEP